MCTRWWRAKGWRGLARYTHEVFVQMPHLGLRPSTALYNAVIVASVNKDEGERCGAQSEATYLTLVFMVSSSAWVELTRC
jgi:hypothetical protein